MGSVGGGTVSYSVSEKRVQSYLLAVVLLEQQLAASVHKVLVRQPKRPCAAARVALGLSPV